MANSYEDEILKDQKSRDNLILSGVVVIYDSIRDKSQKLAMQVKSKAMENTEYFQEYNRAEKFAVKTNKELRPSYLKRDKFSKDRYIEEYRTGYYYAKYGVENQALKDGYNITLPKYDKKQFQKAINYPLSKLMNPDKMKVARSIDIQQVYTTIVSGVEQGLSLQQINRNIDKDLGFRDRQTGKWIKDKALRKGQQYKTMRILRTEVGRMRSIAETDQWINQQDVLESDLVWLATLDSRTRAQSSSMDGNKANKKGQFKYPGASGWHKQRQSGVAAYDINDRCTTIQRDPEYPPESRIERDPKTGENKVKPFQTFKEYADNNELKTNIYGEVLFK